METIDNPCHCNCGWAGPAGDLRHVRYEEVAPGEIMPLGMCPKCRKKILPASASRPPRVTITIEAGSISTVESDAPVDVLTIVYDDEDIEGADKDYIHVIGGAEAVVHHHVLRVEGFGIDTDNTARIYREFEAKEMAHVA